MADYMNMDTLRFVLYKVLGMNELFGSSRYSEYDSDTVNIYLDSIKDFSDQALFPTFREMDEQPAHYEEGRVLVHPTVKTVMEKAEELGLVGTTFDFKDGGMQMPSIVAQAAYFILDAANNHVSGYPGLTGGAAKLVVSFANEELKSTYVPPMISGKWGGTMCLTEPQAGSSLSDITTAAIPREDGSFNIKGQKIFISGGDHQYVENIVHLLLARIEGAPAGTKGISLFVVPKYRPTADGNLASNDVNSAGDFQKMGQRGYCTVHLTFGDKEDCQGWLVGEANQGLKYMFQMMNGARISVGRHGASIATAAYQASLQYANERPQGRAITDSGKKNPEEGQTLIINHPDVRRMLLLQKAVAEGSLCLVHQAALYEDLEAISTGEEKEKYHLLLEILTPIVKTYPAEMGRLSVNNGLQVLGGYGFCSDFILQQYYRDIRIMALYEGTTGIQSLDLLGRKVTLHKGKALSLLIQEMKEVMDAANTFDELSPYSKKLADSLQLNQDVLNFLLAYANKGEFVRFLSDATLYMEFFGSIVLGWLWLKMAVVAKQQMVGGDTVYTAEFYESKVHTMKFFFKYEMPKILGLAESLMDEEILTIPGEKKVVV